jgi:hypothetical protein
MTFAYDPPLGTIEDEAAACRAACAGSKVGDWMRHIHHEAAFEQLDKPVQNRIRYIETTKPERERAARLRALRPSLRGAELAPIWAKYDAELAPIWAKYDAEVAAIRAKCNAELAPSWAKCNAEVAPIWAKCNAEVAAIRAKYDAEVAPIHDAECPNCPWDGKSIEAGWL